MCTQMCCSVGSLFFTQLFRFILLNLAFFCQAISYISSLNHQADLSPTLCPGTITSKSATARASQFPVCLASTPSCGPTPALAMTAFEALSLLGILVVTAKALRHLLFYDIPIQTGRKTNGFCHSILLVRASIPPKYSS